MERLYIRPMGFRATFAVIACIALNGCEPVRSLGLRRSSTEASQNMYEQTVRGDASDIEDPRSVFKSNRLPGGLSSEARQIERETFNIQ